MTTYNIVGGTIELEEVSAQPPGPIPGPPLVSYNSDWKGSSSPTGDGLIRTVPNGPVLAGLKNSHTFSMVFNVLMIHASTGAVSGRMFHLDESNYTRVAGSLSNRSELGIPLFHLLMLGDSRRKGVVFGVKSGGAYPGGQVQQIMVAGDTRDPSRTRLCVNGAEDEFQTSHFLSNEQIGWVVNPNLEQNMGWMHRTPPYTAGPEVKGRHWVRGCSGGLWLSLDWLDFKDPQITGQFWNEDGPLGFNADGSTSGGLKPILCFQGDHTDPGRNSAGTGDFEIIGAPVACGS